MQSMFDTVETENQLSFAEKLHFRVLNSEYSIENRAILVIKYVYTLTVGRQGNEYYTKKLLRESMSEADQAIEVMKQQKAEMEAAEAAEKAKEE